MNPVIGYVLIALAVLNLVGLLLLFRRFGTAPSATPAAPAATPVTQATPTSNATSAYEDIRDIRDEPTPAVPPDALAAMLRRLENRLGDIEDQVRRNPAVTVAGEPGAATDRALALAQRLARQGASAKDISETCGISLTEAELLQRLHAPR
ncbi:hypothetical protein BJI69_01865 [Luteibacter rhizovicinus DSM 16549]|uniref:Uncharacterized protein n=1 Tax=Luteibacter rhizovicinus DSM 16549 TaxID=1440763 RepID=A0A0G9HF97_9GAMM|nr:DUF2802 domain-containing protein [Luteibacter rhizovicinus]APG02778.1 hypothetical protein BJI69_01865 [Luteibacter rhizovicinus DSM 16549]KLD66332.1 hypothetical protein Y883_14300 [Luteibacter rhizovicinus DSM 16549]KLD73389.1 hypothetical protein Y886_38320 [Xanthomonas hyacinthi DSM 19077]